MHISNDSSIAPIAAVPVILQSAPQVSQAVQPNVAAQASSDAPSDTPGETLAAVYTASAGGKDFSADVEESEAGYTVSIPDPPGGTVSAQSLTEAENDLGIRIDELV